MNERLEALEPVKKNYDDLLKAKEIENKGIEGLERRLQESLGRLSALQESEAILKRLSGNEEEYCKLQKEIPELELIRDNHNEVKSSLENEKTKIFSLESAISRAEKTIDELMKLQSTLKIIEPLKHDYDALQKEHSIVEIQKNKKYQIDNLNARADFLFGQISKLSEDANAADYELSALSNLDEREAMLIEQDKSMHAIGEELNRNLIDLKSRGSVYQSKRDEAKSSLERVRILGAKGNCPTCERPLGEQHEVLLSKYMRELSEADERSAELDTEIRTIVDKIEKNILDREDIKRSLDSINCDKSRRAGLNAHLKAKLEQTNGIQAEMEGVRKSIEDLGPAEYDPVRFYEIASKINEIQPQIIDYDSLVIRLKELSEKEKELKGLREERMICVKTLQDLNEKLARFEL